MIDVKSTLVLSKETRLQCASRQLGIPDMKETKRVLLESKVDVPSMVEEDRAHAQSLERVCTALETRSIAFRVVPIGDSVPADFDGHSLIVSVGGDGSFVHCTRHIHDGRPILGVNSNPPSAQGQRIWSVGYYTRTDAPDFSKRLDCLLKGKESKDYKITRLNRMEVDINQGEERLQAFAEVFIGHPLRKRNSRHLLEVDGLLEEQHKTSGLIVYPPHAYTAWAEDEGADPPADPSHIYYFVTGIQSHRDIKLRGGPIRDRMRVTSSLMDGVVSVDTWTDFPLMFGQTVEIRKSEQDIHMIEFPG